MAIARWSYGVAGLAIKRPNGDDWIAVPLESSWYVWRRNIPPLEKRGRG
jgi:hypothetical protein